MYVTKLLMHDGCERLDQPQDSQRQMSSMLPTRPRKKLLSTDHLRITLTLIFQSTLPVAREARFVKGKTIFLAQCSYKVSLSFLENNRNTRANTSTYKLHNRKDVGKAIELIRKKIILKRWVTF